MSSSETFFVAMADYGNGFATFGGEIETGRVVFAQHDVNQAIRAETVADLTRKLAGNLKRYRPVSVTRTIDISTSQFEWASLEEAFNED